MRKEYGQALRNQFSKSVKKYLPNFAEMKYSDPLYPGQKIYRWIALDSIHCFLVLVPNPNSDEFSIEMGWSKQGRFPVLKSRPSSILQPIESNSLKEECLFRVTQLSRNRDYWWPVGKQKALLMEDPLQAAFESVRKISKQEAEAVVIPSCDEAVQEFIDYGLPFLNKILIDINPVVS
jgi:hypothetical protein